MENITKQASLGGAGVGPDENPLIEVVAPADIIRVIPFGRFHWILIVIHLIMYLSSSFVIYNMGFL